MAAPFVEALRPKPFRGDVIAAGVVVLTTLVWLLTSRFGEQWGPGVHVAYSGLAVFFVATLAVLAPMEHEAPRAYQSVLYVAAFALALLALLWLGDLLGADGGAGRYVWTFALMSAVGFGFAWGRNSAVSTLLGAVSAAAAVLAFVVWAFDAGSATRRWTLVVLVIVFALSAVAQRDRRRRHGVAFIDAAGLIVLLIGAGLVVAHLAGYWIDLRVPSVFAEVDDDIAWGWALFILGSGFGLIAYSSVDREPGPAYLGVLALVEFAVIAQNGGFAGWPLVLVAIAAFLLIIGLRPTTPAPPPPDADVPPAPTEPLRPADA